MTILFRADASTAIGIGHITRCLAMAQVWQQRGNSVIFASQIESPYLEAGLRSKDVQIQPILAMAGSSEDAQETVQLARQTHANWVVVDGYHFDAEYQQFIKKANLRLLTLDDCMQLSHYCADLVLNPEFYADECLYQSKENYTQFLLGPAYILLRHEFLSWQDWRRSVQRRACKILITLGGSDPDNVGLKVLQGLNLIEEQDLDITLVVGASNPYYQELESESNKSRVPIKIKRNVANMPELMVWADLAITGGGSTTWEAAFLGLASVAIVLTERQQANVEALASKNICANLGWHENVTAVQLAKTISAYLDNYDLRSKIASLGPGLIDGAGASRVVNKMIAYA